MSYNRCDVVVFGQATRKTLRVTLTAKQEVQKELEYRHNCPGLQASPIMKIVPVAMLMSFQPIFLHAGDLASPDRKKNPK